MSKIYMPIYTDLDWKKEENKIVSGVNTSWTKDQIVLYLVATLAPLFQRDLNYFLLSDEEKYNIYKKGITNNKDGIVVCKSLCDYYYNLLKKYDIKTNIIQTSNNTIPHYGLIVFGDTNAYFLDLINGLMSFQYDIIYRYYGKIPEFEKKSVYQKQKNIFELDRTYIKELAKSINLNKFGYTQKKIYHLQQLVYTNGGWKKIFGLEDDLNLITKKIEYISKHFSNIGNVNGAIERKLMYLYLIRNFFDDKEKNKIKTMIWRNNPDDLTDVNIKIKLADKNRTVEYVEDKVDNKFVLVKKNEFDNN